MPRKTLSAREVALVRQLGFFRYLTPAQAAELLFAGSRLKPRSREVIAARLLAGLRRTGLVTTNAYQAGEPDAPPTRVVHFLTAAGLRAFDELEPDAPSRRMSVRGTLLVAHSLMVADIALAFRRTALANPGHELELWECDWQIGERLAGTLVVPDARFVYATGLHRIHGFIEADRGTERTRFFRGKVGRYLDLHRSGAWQRTLTLWPLVLTVTRTESRVDELCHATESVLQTRREEAIGPAFRFAAVDELRQTGPLSQIWRVPGRVDRHRIAELPDGGDLPIDAQPARG